MHRRHMDNQTLILLVAGPGEMRDGLECLLLATGEVDQVTITDNVQSALDIAQDGCLDLVFLDLSITADQSSEVLADLSRECPQARCMALSNDVSQQRQAEAAGADLAVVKGFPAAELSAAVSGLLSAERVKSKAGSSPM